MILAVDVQYVDNRAFVAGVSFDDWNAEQPDMVYESTVDEIAAYVPGQFYKRELPCILALLSEHELSPDVIVVDGYVYLGDHSKPGLGMHLYNALEGKVSVIGVAKSEFYGASDGQEVYRGKSKVPLFVTSIGIDSGTAKGNIIKMSGNGRIPALLKRVDRICREKADSLTPE